MSGALKGFERWELDQERKHLEQEKKALEEILLPYFVKEQKRLQYQLQSKRNNIESATSHWKQNASRKVVKWHLQRIEKQIIALSDT